MRDCVYRILYYYYNRYKHGDLGEGVPEGLQQISAEAVNRHRSSIFQSSAQTNRIDFASCYIRAFQFSLKQIYSSLGLELPKIIHMGTLCKNVIKVPALWFRFKGLKLRISSEIELPKPTFLPASLAKLHPAFFFGDSQKNNKISLVSFSEDATGEAHPRSL